MAVDTYLRFDGIKGDSLDHQHKDWIEAWDLSWGVKQPRSTTVSTAGGHTAGRCEHRPVTLLKNLDLASAKLWQLCCSGGTIKEAVIERFRANGEERVKYLELRLYDVVVHAIDPHSTDLYMAEQLALVYSKIGWRQTALGIDGRVLGNTTGGWDLAQNRPFAMPSSN
jgi:type VI secretion system secreted protein Hcp